MKQEGVHIGGMFGAAGIALFATIGTNLTTFRGIGSWDAFWIASFVVAVLLLSAAACDFDMKRWLW